LPDEALPTLAEGSPEFALRVAVLQVEEEIYQDGKLGPRTLQALIERRIEAENVEAPAQAPEPAAAYQYAGWHHHISVVLCCFAFVVAERVQHFPPSQGRQVSADPLGLAA
jgi:hypothetical protein